MKPCQVFQVKFSTCIGGFLLHLFNDFFFFWSSFSGVRAKKLKDALAAFVLILTMWRMSQLCVPTRITGRHIKKRNLPRKWIASLAWRRIWKHSAFQPFADPVHGDDDRILPLLLHHAGKQASGTQNNPPSNRPELVCSHARSPTQCQIFRCRIFQWALMISNWRNKTKQLEIIYNVKSSLEIQYINSSTMHANEILVDAKSRLAE